MGEIVTSERQITLFCHSQSNRAKPYLVYAKAQGLPILQIDMLKTTLTGTPNTELADRLGLEIKDMVNQDHHAYTKYFEHLDFSLEDWIKMIKNNHEIMKQPIALMGKLTILVEIPNDIIMI